MKKLLIKFLVIFLILMAIDFLWGIFFLKIVDISKEGRYYKAKYTLDLTSEDLLIIGSSLGEAGYCTKIFEDSLNITCYNVSRENQLLPYFNAIKEATLARYVPTYIVFDIHPSFLQGEPNHEIVGEVFNPFYKTHPEIQSILNNGSLSKKIIYLSNLYCFNSSYIYLLLPFIKKGMDRKVEDKGWRPRYGITAISSKIKILNPIGNLNKKAINEFHQFVDTIHNKGIQLIFCSSPMYNTTICETPTIKYVKKYAKENDIPYFDYANHKELLYNNEYFKDPAHFNDKGAIAFSKSIIQDIKSYLEIEN